MAKRKYNLQNCECGQQPKFERQKLWMTSVDFFRLVCKNEKCKTKPSTFGTAQKEFAVELWQAAQNRRLLNEIKINKS